MTRGRRAGRFLLPGLWIAVTLAIGIGAWRLPWRKALAEVAALDTAWLAIAITLNFAILPLWALEWRLLVPRTFRVSGRRMFGIVAVTASVLNSIPMLAGEISAVALLISRGGLTQGAALSVLAMDQVLVALAKVAVLVAAALTAPIPEWLRTGLLSLGAVLGLALTILSVLAHRWERIQNRLGAGRSAMLRWMGRLASWGTHLDVLRDHRVAAAVSALALAKKALEVLAVLAIQFAFGMSPSVPVALMVVAALALSTLVPVAPANLGVYEATVYAVYRFTGTSAETALGLALVQHLAFLLPSLATGYLILTARQLVPGWRQAV